MFYLRFKLNLLHKIIDYLLIVLNHIAVKLRVLTFYCHLQTLRQRPDSTDTTAMKNEITKNQTSHITSYIPSKECPLRAYWKRCLDKNISLALRCILSRTLLYCVQRVPPAKVGCIFVVDRFEGKWVSPIHRINTGQRRSGWCVSSWK